MPYRRDEINFLDHPRLIARSVEPGSALHIGTCSWKYDSWRGIVYSGASSINHLAEYSQKYDCVEVDQWFWSLFGPDKVVLPKPSVVEQYAAAVPDTFRFGIKMPNALTLTHFRPKRKTDPLVPNPHFLSIDVLNRTLERLEPLYDKLGPLMFQFGYLNKRIMPSQATFLDRLAAFAAELPASYTWAIETRNPNYLNTAYFDCLRENNLAHVFLQGYYMPPVLGPYNTHAEMLTNTVVLRLHGGDREGIEQRSGKDWSRIIDPRDKELEAVAGMLKDTKARRKEAWVFVNNHYEGCAPLTIEQLKQRMGDSE